MQRKVRILIGFVQVLSQLPRAFPRLRFPLGFLRLLNWLPVFAFDIFSVFGTLGCVFERWSYHQELLFATLWPAAVMGSLLLLGHACGGAAVRERTEYLALFVSFLVFPRTSVVVFAAFRCDAVEMGAGSESSQRWLRAAYEIDCDGAAHRWYGRYASGAILAYPVGIPLVYAALLRSSSAAELRDRLSAPKYSFEGTSAHERSWPLTVQNSVPVANTYPHPSTSPALALRGPFARSSPALSPAV